MVLIGELFVMAGSFSFIFFILICMINVQAKEEKDFIGPKQINKKKYNNFYKNN